MKKYIYPMAFAATALFATACSDDVVDDIQNKPDSEKEMISFSLSDGANTRAGLHGTAATTVVMRIMSEKKNSSDKLYVRTKATASAQVTGTDGSTYSKITFDDLYKCYWDDCFGRSAQLSVYAVAVPGKEGTNSKVSESSLSAGVGSNSAKWGSTDANTITWTVSSGTTNVQSSTTLDNEDLVYSRNIREDGQDGRYTWSYTAPTGYPSETGKETHSPGRMIFTQDPSSTAASDAGHFDKGHLVFTHALSRIDVTLVSGDGFKDSDDNDATHDFVLSDDGIIFSGMNVSADLNLTDGKWGNKTTGNVIVKPNISSKVFTINNNNVTKAIYNGTIQVLPDYTFGSSSTTNVITFTIDGNTYYVDQKMVYEALKEADGVTIANNAIALEQQKRYFLTITVNKTKIDNVTATLQPWVDVNAEQQPLYNSYVSLSISSATGTCDDVDLYRLNDGNGTIYTNLTSETADSKEFYNWKGQYTQKAELSKPAGSTAGDGKFTTNWYFEDNKTFYHFRTVNKTLTTSLDNTGTNSKFKMVSGPQATSDYHWGAPMKSDANFAYGVTADNNNHVEGYSTSIYKAIGSTKDPIMITELHMMSNINVVLETTTTSDKVDLSNAKVYLTKFITEGSVDMGSGYITPDASKIATDDVTATSAVSMTSPGTGDAYWATSSQKTKPFTYAVVPQVLSRGSSDGDYIGITIVTNDNNQYYIVKDLSKIFATSTTQGGSTKDDPDQKTATDTSTDAEKLAAAITRWYPNHNYTYTFKITKKGIDNITCTLANWIDVTAANKDLTLED